LSRPTSGVSSQRGRVARIMATDMAAMAMTPLYCMATARKPK
jgi:hypothetical protein